MFRVPLFNSGVIGMILKWLTGRALIIDYRDPFGLEVVFSILGVSESRRKIIRYIDRKIVSNADCFIVTSEETIRGTFKELGCVVYSKWPDMFSFSNYGSNAR